MKKFVLGTALAFLLFQPVAGFCRGDLDVFLSNLKGKGKGQGKGKGK